MNASHKQTKPACTLKTYKFSKQIEDGTENRIEVAREFWTVSHLAFIFDISTILLLGNLISHSFCEKFNFTSLVYYDSAEVVNIGSLLLQQGLVNKIC